MQIICLHVGAYDLQLFRIRNIMMARSDTMNPLRGIHHVTAITSSAEKIYQFFTYVLGLRLVKKTINQDDIQTYHLFFADDRGNAGTDMTFFDFPGSVKGHKGRDELAITGFRVPDDAAIEYWKRRFEKYNVNHQEIQTLFSRKMLFFTDFDGQEYALVSDENNQGISSGTPWQKGPIPLEFSITGLGPMFVRVSDPNTFGKILSDLLFMTQKETEGNYTRFDMGDGGNGGMMITIADANSRLASQGFGSIHHVAFRVASRDELNEWISYLTKIRAPHSGFVDRFYFQSLYTRLYRPVLFEFATEGPGFIDDEESYETLGETLALPPKFRSQRAKIESLVRHIDTKRSHLTFEKEYL